MKWNPSEMHWMHHMHMPHVHAIRPHPAHWLSTHPLLLALLIAVLITMAIIGLASITNTGIRMDTLQPFDYQMSPYSGAH